MLRGYSSRPKFIKYAMKYIKTRLFGCGAAVGANPKYRIFSRIKHVNLRLQGGTYNPIALPNFDVWDMILLHKLLLPHIYLKLQ